MSYYTPITGELRDAMAVRKYEFEGEHIVRKELTVPRETFYRLCDAIDSIHAQLELENAALKSSAAHAYASGYEYAEMDRDGWVELPKDADGVPIHIGDGMVYADGNTCPLPVVALVPPAVFLTDDGPRYADMCRHAPDTWERIIEDAIGEGMARQRNNDSGNFCERANPMNNGDFVARCKALCERTKGDA